MRIVTNNTIVHREGHTLHLERGANVRRVNVSYEHVRQPVTVPKPQLEDFNSLVVIHDRVEYYS